MTLKLALFGGSFDPVHLAHLELAIRAQKKLRFDFIDFIPAKLSPHKDQAPLFDAKTRLELVKLATDDYDFVRVNDVELVRDSESYSYLTVKHYQDQYPDSQLFWLMGYDAWLSLKSWHEFSFLAETLTFVVARRSSTFNLEQAKELIQKTKTIFIEDFYLDISATRIRSIIQSNDKETLKSSSLLDDFLPLPCIEKLLFVE